jgi:hypothetical protein
MTPPIRQEKRKNRPQRILITSMGCLFAVGMLTVGALLGGLLGAVLLPDTFGWSATQNALLTLRADIDETAIALAGRELALANTQTANNTRATQNALNAAATLAALTNQQSLIDQTATRSARDIIATQTSIALENARQGTQVALDYAATQAGLQREATQVELNYQQTQAALGNSVLPNSQSDAVANASVNNPSATPTQTPTRIYTLTSSVTPSLTPTHTPSATYLPPASDTPTSVPSATPLPLDEDFTSAPDATWRVSDSLQWEQNDGRMRAVRDGAWLLRNSQYDAPYRLYTAITPALAENATYALIIAGRNAPSDNGYALVYEAEGLQVNTVALYRWRYDDSAEWDVKRGQLLKQEDIEGLLIGNTALVITLSDDGLRAQLNGETVLRYTPPTTDWLGTVGVVLPSGASLNQMTLTLLGE